LNKESWNRVETDCTLIRFNIIRGIILLNIIQGVVTKCPAKQWEPVH
jgi:hypothetical protein